MTQYAAGSITSGKDGCVFVRIWGEPHYIYPEELGRLIFMGDCVPLLRHQPTANDPPQVSGTVHMNLSGRGIVIGIGDTHYQLSRVPGTWRTTPSARPSGATTRTASCIT